MPDNKYIKKRPGRTNLYYQRSVPKELHYKFGKVIQETLATSDMREARLRRDEKNVEWNRKFQVTEANVERNRVHERALRVMERLRGLLECVIEENEWPDEAVAEASPWIDWAEGILQHADKVPVDVQQKIHKLTVAIQAFHSDPISFDREKASQLLSEAVPKKSMTELRDLYLKAKRDQGIVEKSVKSQQSRLKVLEEQGWDVDEVMELLKERGRPDKTIENWMTTYATFARFLKDKHDVSLSVPHFKRTKYSQTRDAFTMEELKVIFTEPMDETMRWVALISLHQGFRAGEVLQLNYRDVREHHGYWIFDIHDRDKGKRVKTKNTVRKVPVHPWLIENGFLDYWESHKGWARGWKSYDGSPSQGFSKAANRMIRGALGLKTSQTPTGQKVFHSFRHTFRDFSREAGLQEYLIDRIGGWSTAKYGEGAGYGQGHSVKAMYDLLETVRPLE